MIDARLNPRPAWLTPSAVVLIAANLVPLVCVVFFHWTLFDVVLLFWAESVIIGAINVLRMLTASPKDLEIQVYKLFVTIMFVGVFFLLIIGHGIFVFMVFGSENPEINLIAPDLVFMLKYVFELGFGIPFIVLCLSHAFSFFWNYLGRGEYLHANVESLMGRPIGRVFLLHIVIIAGGYFTLANESPMSALALFILLKVAFDLRAHLKEHGEKLKAEVEYEPTFKEILARLNEAKRRARRAPMSVSAEESNQEP